MTYRHSDGSFSAFGPNSYGFNETGGTWLTAFVLRCFADTFDSKHIEIDINDLKTSLKLLMTRQNKDGSFDQLGVKLYSAALAGALKTNQGLTAYVLISLLKTKNALRENESIKNYDLQITKTFQYLKNSLVNINDVDTYTLALSLYAFKMSNYDVESAIIIENELDKRAFSKNGFIYWSEMENFSSSKTFQNTKAADLEITAYVLLSKLFEINNKENVNTIISISKWINSQRNSYGGFYSTQVKFFPYTFLKKS